MNADHWRLDARTLSDAYAVGSISPLEVARSVLERAREVQPGLNPMTHIDEEGAIASAKESESRWRRGVPRSRLDGVPATVKDNINVRDMPCRWGSRLYEEHVPSIDETPVRRLRDAGVVLLGKTNVPELTLLGFTDNLLHGPTRNPWDPALTPGGSSGGAVVAVATGLGPIALATDGGGSIRRPCSHTGTVGLKPSEGRVPRANGLPELLSGLEVIGPVARTVEDLLLVLEVIGPRPAAQQPAPLRSLRVACWRHIGESPVDPDVQTSFDNALDRLRQDGMSVEVLPAPSIVERFNRDAWPVLAGSGLEQVLRPWAQRLGESIVRQLLTQEMAAMWEAARHLPAGAVSEAHAVVAQLGAAIKALFDRYDVLVTPTAAALPWPVSETHPGSIDNRPVGPRAHAVFTAFVNACGLPALALPTTPVASGLPTGMQLVGRPDSEELLCALGQRWELLEPWRLRWPNIQRLQGPPLI